MTRAHQSGTVVAVGVNCSHQRVRAAAGAKEESMSEKKQGTLVSTGSARDPFALLRQMTSELDHAFEHWPSFRWPSGLFGTRESGAWSPKIDVFERDNRLVTRVDLPGMRKEDVSVEVTDGHLALSGERKRETEEKKDNFYRSEREYGSFYRAVPLPEGAKVEDVKATFADGVLEVSVALPAHPEATVRKVQIEEPKKTAKSAA
jgi:HSP20 family protein